MVSRDSMEPTGRAFQPNSILLAAQRIAPPAFAALLALTCVQCASPGPPRAPSLQLPIRVSNLSADRVGDHVELRFSVPQTTTDRGPVRSGTLPAALCRAEGTGPCLPLGGVSKPLSFPLADDKGEPNLVMLEDDLPAALRSGPPRLLSYQVEFFGPAHRSAGLSEPAFTAAGSAPPDVTGLRAEGSRQGVLLQWQPGISPDHAEVLLRRELAGARPEAEPPASPAQPGSPPATRKDATRKPATRRSTTHTGAAGTTWLQANAGTAGESRTLDGSAVTGETYLYAGQRRLHLELAGHAVDLRSEVSAPVTLRLLDTFPPPAPTGLTAAAFGSAGGYAVDLIWEPVDDRTVTGYLVSRVPTDPQGTALGAPVDLTATPLHVPAFHDTTADPAAGYRYQVIAVDAKENRSAASKVDVKPMSTP